jgi:hypothetical protein
MKLSSHPFGRPYLHKPTGKVIYLSNPASLDGKMWSAHYKYRETMIVHADDLEIPLQSQVIEHYPNQK